MNIFRVIIIIAIFGLIVLVGFLLLRGNSVEPVVVPEPVDVSNPGVQENTPVNPTPNPVEVTYFEEAPVGYSVRELPVSGLINSVVSPSPSEEFIAVQEEIFLDVFWVLECVAPSGETEQALIITAQPAPGAGDIIQARAAIQNWEPQIAKDIGRVLYPKVNSLPFENVSLSFDRYDANSRFAEFSISDRSYQIHYGWVLNFAIFAPSHNCLMAAIDDTYAPHSH